MPSISGIPVAERPTQQAMEMSLVRAHWPGLALGFSDGVNMLVDADAELTHVPKQDRPAPSRKKSSTGILDISQVVHDGERPRCYGDRQASRAGVSDH